MQGSPQGQRPKTISGNCPTEQTDDQVQADSENHPQQPVPVLSHFVSAVAHGLSLSVYFARHKVSDVAITMDYRCATLEISRTPYDRRDRGGTPVPCFVLQLIALEPTLCRSGKLVTVVTILPQGATVALKPCA
jgi:hypothetical protein